MDGTHVSYQVKLIKLQIICKFIFNSNCWPAVHFTYLYIRFTINYDWGRYDDIIYEWFKITNNTVYDQCGSNSVDQTNFHGRLMMMILIMIMLCINKWIANILYTQVLIKLREIVLSFMFNVLCFILSLGNFLCSINDDNNFKLN